MNELREIIFTDGTSSTVFKDGLCYEEAPEEKRGYLHQFGNHPIYDRDASRWVDETIAIVEEKGSGKMFVIIPQWIIKFVTPLQQD